VTIGAEDVRCASFSGGAEKLRMGGGGVELSAAAKGEAELSSGSRRSGSLARRGRMGCVNDARRGYFSVENGEARAGVTWKWLVLSVRPVAPRLRRCWSSSESHVELGSPSSS